ncbi:DUF6134 family protein [Phenylobacterium sp.]|uniref:DUF6134 family protein n=1 Tax=Phenylobacterium sp. TaxID=1871053 RepID=UPI00286A3CA3|nr:DUF6134 family protein [Phenylobacterium sp.]
MAEHHPTLARRTVLAGGLVVPLMPRLAAAAPRALAFAVFRNGTRIGEHRVSFTGDGAALTAATDAVMTVRLGPVPVFRYHHKALETRSAGVLATLETSTVTNGRTEHVVAERIGAGVRIDGPSGRVTLGADVNPLTHWNPQVLAGPLFNPQTGRIMQVRTTRVSPTHWTIRGETEIDDTYDALGAWQSLKGKLTDGSVVEYRRI